MVKDKNYANMYNGIDLEGLNPDELAKIELVGRNWHIWKKYILDFIIENEYKDFTLSDISRYILKRYNSSYGNLTNEEFTNRIKSTLNQLAKDRSFKKSRDYKWDFEKYLEKHGLYDIKLEEFNDFWSVNFIKLEDQKRKEDLLRKLTKKS